MPPATFPERQPPARDRRSGAQALNVARPANAGEDAKRVGAPRPSAVRGRLGIPLLYPPSSSCRRRQHRPRALPLRLVCRRCAPRITRAGQPAQGRAICHRVARCRCGGCRPDSRDSRARQVLQRGRCGLASPDGDVLGQLGNGERCGTTLLRFAIKQATQRDAAGGVAGLEERHRPHPQPGETASAGVAGDVVRRHCRTRQDELSACRALVYAATNVVPDFRRQLPLVEQSGHLPYQDGRRIDARHPLRVEVYVEEHVAGAGLCRRGRLANRPSALHEDGTGRIQQIGEFGVRDARAMERCGTMPQK